MNTLITSDKFFEFAAALARADAEAIQSGSDRTEAQRKVLTEAVGAENTEKILRCCKVYQHEN